MLRKRPPTHHRAVARRSWSHTAFGAALALALVACAGPTGPTAAPSIAPSTVGSARAPSPPRPRRPRPPRRRPRALPTPEPSLPADAAPIELRGTWANQEDTANLRIVIAPLTYRITRFGDSGSGSISVTGDVIRFSDSNICPGVGEYRWTLADGILTFEPSRRTSARAGPTASRASRSCSSSRPRRRARRRRLSRPYHPRAMRFGAAFWVNRCSWADLRDAALAAERAGWDSIWIDDHLLADEGDPDDRKLEGWTTLAALAALTSTARLGSARGGQHLPLAGPDRQAGHDARSPVRRARRAGHRRRLVRARARGLRHRLRLGLRRAPGSPGRGGRADPPAARWRAHRRAPRPLLRAPRRAGRAAAGAGPAAHPHRRLRTAEDAAHDGPRRRPVERLRAAGAGRGQLGHPRRALRGDRPAARGHRADGDRPPRRARQRGGGARRLVRRSRRATGWRVASAPTGRSAG